MPSTGSAGVHAADRLGDGRGLLAVGDDRVVQRAMGFDVADRSAAGLRQRLQRADLIHDVGEQVFGVDVDEAPTEPGQVAVTHLGSDPHAALGGRPAYPQQPRRVSGMEAARDVGAGDDPEHGVVVTELPDAESFAQVGVEVDTGHPASLGRRDGAA